MAAIDFLIERGLRVRRAGLRVRVSPRAMVTDEVTRYVRLHRLEILSELSSNDGIERRCGWTVTVPGYRPFTMISPDPLTHAEALADVRCRWPGAEVN